MYYVRMCVCIICAVIAAAIVLCVALHAVTVKLGNDCR